MLYWSAMCLAVGTILNDEAIGWICLLLAAAPWFFRFFYGYAKIIARENSRIAEIDEDGFYL